MKYELEELEEFIRETKSANIKKIGIAVISEAKDAGTTLSEGKLVPIQSLTVLLIVSAASEKDVYSHASHIGRFTIITEGDAKKAEKEVLEKKNEYIEIIQKAHPQVIILKGRLS